MLILSGRKGVGFWRGLVEEVVCELGFEELAVIWTQEVKKAIPDKGWILVLFGRQ